MDAYKLSTSNFNLIVPILKTQNPEIFRYITCLNLSNIKLDLIPQQIGYCEMIQDLNLSNNLIRVLPTRFLVYYFPFLKILDVSCNKITSIECLSDLNCLCDLEILNCYENPLPKVTTHVELIESLVFVPPKFQYFRNRGIQARGTSIFLKLGSYFFIKDHMIEVVSDIVKADQYLILNKLESLGPHTLDNQDLSVDITRIQNGSLFSTIETKNTIYITGPSITLEKDPRLEAPIVYAGRIKKLDATDEIKAGNVKKMNNQLKHIDSTLQDIKKFENVSHIEIKFGFFGEEFFCYNKPHALESIRQKRNITTKDLISRKTVKDVKIVTDIPGRHFEQFGIDPKKMLPSEIEDFMKKQTFHDYSYINMNQRPIGAISDGFPRLRLLNGKSITVNDLDKAQKMHKSKSEMASQARQDALAHCQQRIPTSLKQAVIDFESGKTIFSTKRPLSEMIKKRQVYERLTRLSKQEKQQALKEMREFMENGTLSADDNALLFAARLRAYDADKDEDLEQFMTDCTLFVQDYVLEAEAAERAKNNDRADLAETLMQSQDYQVQTQVDEIDLTKTKQLTNESLSSPRYSQTTARTGIRRQNTLDMIDILQDLSKMQLPTLVINDLDENVEEIEEREFMGELALTTTDAKNAKKKMPLANSHDAELLNELLMSKRIKRDQSKIGQSLAQAEQMQEIEDDTIQRDVQLQSQLYQNLVIGPGMQSSLKMSKIAAMGDATKVQLSTDPVKVLKCTAVVVDQISRKQFGSDINLSKIIKNPVKTKANTLPSERYVDQEEIKVMKNPKEFVDLSQLRDLQAKPQKLIPDFQLVMRHELEQQQLKTGELFVHVAKNLDLDVRKSLTTKRSQFRIPELNQSRHSTLLDVVMEGDKIMGNPNGIAIVSELTGPMTAQKMNEAQEIMNTGKIIQQKPVKKLRQKSVLNFTSSEVMNKIDDRLKRQNLKMNQQILSQNNVTKKDEEIFMKQMLRANQEQIERANQQMIHKEHLDHLRTIKNEKAIGITDVISPTKATYLSELKKLDMIKAKQVKKLTSQQQFYKNDMVKHQVITDQSTLVPISVKNEQLRRTYGQFVNPLDIQTTEEAAHHAAELKVDADELIKHTGHIMRNGEAEVRELQQYQTKFINGEIEWDAKRADPVYQLLKSNTTWQTAAALRDIEYEPTYQKSELVDQVEALLDGRSSNETALKKQIHDAFKTAEEIKKKLGDY